MALLPESHQGANQALRESLSYQTRLNNIIAIHEADALEEVLDVVERQILALVGAERLTLYRRGRHAREIVAIFKTGAAAQEIRVPVSPSSIAGYVALSQQPICINDVYEKAILTAIHPRLCFDDSFDRQSGWRTRAMIAVPVKFKKTLLGILQIVNKLHQNVFTETDIKHAQDLAHIIGQKFHYEMNTTQSPFDDLVRRALIDRESLKQAESRSGREGKSVAFLLVNEFGVAVDELGESLSKYYQVPFHRYVPGIELPQELMKNLNKAYLKSSRWVPIAGNRDKAVVVIDDPNDYHRIMEIQQTINAHTYEFQVGIREDILSYLGDRPAVLSDADSAGLSDLVERLEERTGLRSSYGQGNGHCEDEVDENDAPVIQLVNRLIVDAARFNASDIHIEPGRGELPATVRMRIDGICAEVLRIPSEHVRPVIARIKILSRLDIAERRKPQDGKMSVRVKGKTIELRVATIPTVNGESAVLRVLAAGDALPFEKLNMSARNAEETLRLISQPHGIFLVAGPTGSGKTTTLHGILRFINTPERKIWTAEDPVEITQPGLQQVQIQPSAGVTFAGALRAFLRADPDVIFIGEMRDRETSRIGVEASLTGHLVFSTLHTNSAPETITRLLGLDLDPLDFADALLGVLAQRLVRTLCDSCKVEYLPGKDEIAHLAHVYGCRQGFDSLMARQMETGEIRLVKAAGCSNCGKSGYRGRTGIHELLVATSEMKRVISQNVAMDKIRDLAIEQGMTTLKQDGVEKVLKGQIDLEQLRRVAVV